MNEQAMNRLAGRLESHEQALRQLAAVEEMRLPQFWTAAMLEEHYSCDWSGVKALFRAHIGRAIDGDKRTVRVHLQDVKSLDAALRKNRIGKVKT